MGGFRCTRDKLRSQGRAVRGLQLLILCACLANYDRTAWTKIIGILAKRKSQRYFVSVDFASEESLAALRAYVERPVMDASTDALVKRPSGDHVPMWCQALDLVLGWQMWTRISFLNEHRGVLPGHRFVMEIREAAIHALLQRIPESVRELVASQSTPRDAVRWLWGWRQKWDLQLGSAPSKAWLQPEEKRDRVT